MVRADYDGCQEEQVRGREQIGLAHDMCARPRQV